MFYIRCFTIQFFNTFATSCTIKFKCKENASVQLALEATERKKDQLKLQKEQLNHFLRFSMSVLAEVKQQLKKSYVDLSLVAPIFRIIKYRESQ